jgi:DNA-binding transcriptional LysR family regulator
MTISRFSRNLDWNLLKYFHEIGRLGGIGAAAQQLHVAQPSVSAALRKLEDHVGVQLFARSHRGVTATRAGEVLMQDVADIVALIGDTPARIAAVSGTMSGAIRIHTVSYVFSDRLDQGIRRFRADYPGVEMIFTAGTWEEGQAAVEAGEAALGIGFSSRPSSQLHYAPLIEEQVQLYCGSSHPLYGRKVEDLSELDEEALVVFGKGEPPQLRAFRQRHGLDRKVSGTTDSIAESIWLISLGVGLGFLPVPAVQAASGVDLWPLLPPAIIPSVRIDIFHRPHIQNPLTRALVAAIVSE